MSRAGLRPLRVFVSSLRGGDVTQDDLGLVMMKLVVMVTPPEEALFHFTVRDGHSERRLHVGHFVRLTVYGEDANANATFHNNTSNTSSKNILQSIRNI